MTPVWLTLLIGFALGLKHSTEADHIAAVSTLVTDTHGARQGAWVGASWGMGHLLTLFAAGSLLIILHLKMTPRVEWSLELLVDFVLIGLGLRTILRCFRGRYHFHVHEHGSLAHTHLHFHAHGEAGHQHAAHAQAITPQAHHRGALFVGMAHGLAGTAGLALLVLSSIPSRALGVAYLLIFGFGAMMGMSAFSGVLGVPLARASSRLFWLNGLRLAAGAASCGLGAFLACRAFLPPNFPF